MLYILSVLFGVFSTTLIYYVYNKNKINKNTNTSLTEFPQRMQAQDAFTIELMKSNDELSTKPTDTLTGLPARTAFDDRLAQAITQGKRYQSIVGLLSLNVDNFAQVNQSGQSVGDELLMQLAGRLKSTIRQVDTICRYAGNNFLLLMPQLSQPETAAYVAQRIQECLLQPFSVDSHEFFITTSMGIAIYPLDAESVQELIQHANTALQDAKQNGKNNYRFYRQETHLLGERELSIANLLRGEFDISKHLSVQYAPQVLADTGEVTGVQAIPSLKHPEYGDMTWRVFKKIAENAGKTTEILEQTIRLALAQIPQWKLEGITPKWISVSIDSQYIENTHFVVQVIRAFEETNMKEVPLVLEIADSPFQSKSNMMEKSLSLLANAGIQFAIEIYALGHSALHKFPSVSLNYFKVNADLVNNIVLQPANEKILSAMIALAHSTNIDVVAEGIDNQAQKALMRQAGCVVMQGKLFDEVFFTKPISMTN